MYYTAVDYLTKRIFEFGIKKNTLQFLKKLYLQLVLQTVIRLLQLITFLSGIAINCIAQNVYTVSIEQDAFFSKELDGFTAMGFLPQNIPNRQRVIDIRFHPHQPIIVERGDVLYYKFNFSKNRISPLIKIRIEFDIELFDYDLKVARFIGQKHLLDSLSFIQPERYVNSDHKIIQNLIQDLSGQTNEEIARNAYKLVCNRLKYDNDIPENIGAVRALKSGKGDCTEFADLFVSLCRAKGVPSRVITGALAVSGINPNHNWAEFFDHRYGWIPVDPTRGNETNDSFDDLPAQYIYYTFERSDKILKSNVSNYSWQGTRDTKHYTQTTYRIARYADQYYGDAIKFIEQRQYDRALKMSNKMIKSDPANVYYLTLKALALAKMGNFESSHLLYQLAISKANHEQQKTHVYASYANYHALRGNIPYTISFLQGAIDRGYDTREIFVNSDFNHTSIKNAFAVLEDNGSND